MGNKEKQQSKVSPTCLILIMVVNSATNYLAVSSICMIKTWKSINYAETYSNK